VSVGRAATAIAVAVAVAQAGCGGGGRTLRPLRVTIAESRGYFELATTEPIRSVACVIRDHRRSPSDPAAARVVWAARCDGGDCPRAVRYGEQTLTAVTRPERLAPSDQGTCYECVLDGDGTRGRVAFGVTATGNFEPCRGRVGDL
jgi:hypothetical protein